MRREEGDSLRKGFSKRHQHLRSRVAIKIGHHSYDNSVEIHQRKEAPRNKTNTLSKRYLKRKYYEDPLQSELGKTKPPTFNGDKSWESA